MWTNQGINIYNLIFSLVILLTIVFYFGGFDGILFSDDFSYAYYAHELLQGHLILNDDIFSHRLGLYAPVALLYGVLGVNDISTTLYPLACFIATGGLIYFLLYKKDKMAAVASAALWCLGFYPLFFSNKLFPDVVVAFYTFAAGAVLYLRKEAPAREIRRGMLFSFLLFAGFLVKETVLYMMPFIVVILIMDWKERAAKAFRNSAIITALILGLIYFGFYYILKEDPLYRFFVIQEGHYVSGHSYFDKPWTELIKRITYQPFYMLIASELWIPVLFAIPLFFVKKHEADRQDKFWLLAAALIMAGFWFGTTSLKYYNPITINPRMFIPVMPFWAIAGGMGFSHFVKFQRGRGLSVFLSLLVLSPLLAWYLQYMNQVLVYGLLVALFFFLWMMKNKGLPAYTTPLLFMLLLFIHPAYSAWKTGRDNYDASRKIIVNKIPEDRREVLVITDPGLARGNLYFYRFKPPENVEFINFKYRDSILTKAAAKQVVYALVNPKHVGELLEMNYKVPASFIRIPGEWELVSKEDEVSLYCLPVPVQESWLLLSPP